MRIHISLRPSDVVRSIEDGAIGAAQLVGRVAKAMPGEIRQRLHAAKIEAKARQLAKEDVEFQNMTYAEREQWRREAILIAARAVEIQEARRTRRDAA